MVSDMAGLQVKAVDKVKIFAEKSLWDTQVRKRFMMPLVRAHWDDLSPDERLKKYGSRATVSQMVDSIDEADVCSLPMTWNYYVERGLVRAVKEFARQARAAGKNVMIWAEGDFEQIIPIPNVLNFQAGLNRSFTHVNAAAYSVPSFLGKDYADVYCGGALVFRKKQNKPVVGFCGQGAGRLPVAGLWVLRVLKLRALFAMGRASEVPPPLRPPWLLRSKVLTALACSPHIETRFIIRDRYRAGVRSKDELADPLHPTKVEFVNNILNTDYTVCVRGAGNFSQRLYETMCCGRIPIFIDTDCRLPYDFVVDWKQYSVWVDQSQIARLPEILADFHANLTPDEFVSMQQRCRKLWEDRLSTDGFFSHFGEHVAHAAAGAA